MGKTRAAAWITNQDQMLDLATAFIDAVAPGERFVVAGTSSGGYPQPLVVHEDAAFLAALAPNKQNIREFIVAQSIDLLNEFRHVFSPAGAIADHEFLQRLEQRRALSFDVDSFQPHFQRQPYF